MTTLQNEPRWAKAVLNQVSSSIDRRGTGWREWVDLISTGLAETNQRYLFLASGTDCPASGHFVIAFAFLGALRGIPLRRRLIDGSFGVFGLVPPWFARRWSRNVVEFSTGSRCPLKT